MKRPDILSLFSIFLILNLFDAAFTAYGIYVGGFDIEKNPIVHWLLCQADSTLILWLWKFIMLLLVAMAIQRTVGTKFAARMWRVMAASTVIMLLVVVWDSYQTYTIL